MKNNVFSLPAQEMNASSPHLTEFSRIMLQEVGIARWNPQNYSILVCLLVPEDLKHFSKTKATSSVSRD